MKRQEMQDASGFRHAWNTAIREYFSNEQQNDSKLTSTLDNCYQRQIHGKSTDLRRKSYFVAPAAGRNSVKHGY